MIKGCPNENCIHKTKTLEQLKKDFPYYPKEYNLKQLQNAICQLCSSEWEIERFKNF